MEKYTEAVGKRKSAVARVRITPASKGAITINGKSAESYLPGEELNKIARQALVVSALTQKFNITVKVKGGGIHAQAEAISLGIARALNKFDTSLRPAIKKAGLLTRNSRIKERRKFGLKKARKAPQWSKR
ncbi:MAG: 30S ribosomal protein S9 [Patescibacteria group bacterium]